MVHLRFYTGSYIGAAMLLLAGTCQWLFIGWKFDRLLAKRATCSRVLKTLTDHAPKLIVLIVLLNCVACSDGEQTKSKAWFSPSCDLLPLTS
jgi:hypothetical protein